MPRDYHDEDRSHHLGKTAAIAGVVGALAFGIAKPQSRQFLGDQLDGILNSSFGSKFLRGLSNTFFKSGVAPGEFLEELGSHESQLFIQGASAIRSAAKSAFESENRMEAFLGLVKQDIDKEFHPIFESPSFQKLIRMELQSVAKATEASQVSRGLLSEEGIDRFNSVLGRAGITKTNYRSASDQIQKFKAYATRSEAELDLFDRPALDSYMGSQTNKILETIRGERKTYEAKVDALHSATAKTHKDILWSELFKDKSQLNAQEKLARKALEKFLKQRNINNVDKFLIDVQEHVANHLHDAFGANSIGARRAIDEFLGMRSGFSFNSRTGRVISTREVLDIPEKISRLAKEHIQIPLMPFHFNARLKNLSPLTRASNLVNNLGQLRHNSEIYKLLQKGFFPGIGDSYEGAQAVAIGKRVVAVSPHGLEVLKDPFSNTPVSFRIFDDRTSPQIRRVMEARTLNLSLDEANKLRVNPVEFLKQNFTEFGANPNTYSKVQKTSFGLLPLISDIEYDHDLGFMVKAKNTAAIPVVRSLYGTGVGVTPDRLHPTQLAELISTKGFKGFRPEDLATALDSITREAAAGNTNIGNDLALMALDPETNPIFARGSTSASRVIHDVMRAMAPKEGMSHKEYVSSVVEALQGFVDPNSNLTSPFLDKSSSSLLYHNFSSQLYQSVMGVLSHKEDLFSNYLEDSARSRIGSRFVGESGISPLMSKLQQGLVSEALYSKGLNTFGGGTNGAESLVNTIETILGASSNQAIELNKFLSDGSGNVDFLNGFGKDFLGRMKSKFNVNNVSEFEAALSPYFDSEAQVQSTRKIGGLAVQLLDPSEILGLSSDPVTRSKIAASYKSILEEFIVPSSTGDFDETMKAMAHRNELLGKLVLDSATSSGHSQPIDFLQQSLNQRFNITRAWHPQEHGPNPNINQHSFAIPEWIGQPIDHIGLGSKYLSMIDAIFSGDSAKASSITDEITGAIKDQGLQPFITNAAMTARGLIDPNSSLNVPSAFLHAMAMMPQGMAQEAGLGLPYSSMSTFASTYGGWFLKRALPLFLAVEAYKNFNSNAHEMGLPGIDDLGANVVSNVNLWGAQIKDTLGMTGLLKKVVYGVPGLDQYFHPRSYDEYKEYLFSGEEEVRSGRGWVIGSRSPVTGGSIKYVRPNAVRRWRSHWTEASNVDISNPEYSYLPNVTHPFAPLHRLLNPNWFISKHLNDRPYRPGGSGVGYQEDQGNYLTINSGEGYYGDYASIGSFGGEFPTTLTGGGTPSDILTGNGGWGQGSGGGGYGSGGSYGPGYQIHGKAGLPIEIRYHKQAGPGTIHSQFNPVDLTNNFLHSFKGMTGLYGARLEALHMLPGGYHGFHKPDYKQAISNKQILFGSEYGELLGPFGEFFRRIVHQESDMAWNDLPNNMPSWMGTNFRKGDIYSTTPGGYFNLPGEAYERLNPFATSLKIRGSSIGGTVEELIEGWLNPVQPLEGAGAEDIVDFGSATHLMIQRMLKAQGSLIGAEVSIYNKEYNISGTMDAVVQGPYGPEILEIKTQGEKSWGHLPEKYLDQVTTYMATTGIHRASILFVDRDNPSITRSVPLNWDPNRWKGITERIEGARDIVNGMVKRGEISPFETYDLITRIDVLSKVAPESDEFRRLVEYAESSGGFGGYEKQILKRAIVRAKRLSEDYRLYPQKYGVHLATKKYGVQAITDEGDIVTDAGVFKLAGIEFDQQAFAYQSAEEVLAHYGIVVGSKVPITLIKGQHENTDVLNDQTTTAIVGHVNATLAHSIFAHPLDESTNPLDSIVTRGNGGPISQFVENLVHSNSMLSNKFLRVRTALEQLERGEIYGTDNFQWNHIFKTLVNPTMISIAAQNPILAAIKFGTIASLFFKNKDVKAKAFKYGAAIGSVLSASRVVYETVAQKTWIPRRVKKQREFDIYWDMITYVKFTTLAEAARKKAIAEEGVDIQDLSASPKRQSVGLGKWATLAVWAQKRARNTMQGFDEATGSLTEALIAIPKRHRQLAESVISTGSISEKRRFYDLLGDQERRTLGKFLGIDISALPSKPDVVSFFHHHFLPNTDWAGWNSERDLNDLRTRSLEDEQMVVEMPSRGRLERARAYSKDISIPKMNHRTPARIMATLHKLMNDPRFSGISINHTLRPAHNNVININTNLFHDNTIQAIHQTRGELYSGEQQD